MKSHVRASGGLSNLDMYSIYTSMEETLQKVGEIGVAAMKQYTEPHDFDEELSKSLMWRTYRMMGGNEGDDTEIMTPSEWNAVNIGSANDHAYFRENGTGRHKNSEGSVEFVASMRRWCSEKLGFNPEDDPKRFWRIVKKIRDMGTLATPFAFPAIDEIRATGTDICRLEVAKYWRARRQKWRQV